MKEFTTYKLISVPEEIQIKRYGKVFVKGEVEHEVVKVRSKYALVENAKVHEDPNGYWVSANCEDEIPYDVFVHHFANRMLYTDVHPYEVIKHNTPNKMTIREMDAELDEDWKMDVSIGGFAGHVNNNREQRYSYKSNTDNPEKEIRWSKPKRGWFDKHGNRYSTSTSPYKFYDYNF